MTDSDMLAAFEELAAIKASRKRAASIGGKARAAKVSKRRLIAIARKAGLASGVARRERAMEECPRCAVRGCMGDCATILREAKRKAK